MGSNAAWAALGFCLAGSAAWAEMPDPVDQRMLNQMVAADPLAAFVFAFEAGDELTEARFTTERGAGANVGLGQRFTRFPRADLKGPGEWAQHFPAREGGPQAQSCIACHASPLPNGAGALALNVVVDPLQTGDGRQFLERNTLHLFGLGAVQRIAEEMTAELKQREAKLAWGVCEVGIDLSTKLETKGVNFGWLSASPRESGEGCLAQMDYRDVIGIDSDLVVKMFGWKGTHATLRGFTRGAAHNEMGMQAVDLVGTADGDFDGVVNELTVGDLTAMTIYMAGLERPTSRIELDALGLVPLEPAERETILAGERRFAGIGCADCHKPTMTIDDPVFREPSAVPGFAEAQFPSGEMAAEHGLAPEKAISFSLVADQPNNRVELPNGQPFRLGAYESTADGKAIVRWYSDFKRHEMGPALADPVDAFGFGASVWPTRSLAGVGSTGPWLHHGHATTLDEAIVAHGGEAEASRRAYQALPPDAQAEIVAFLENLVITKIDTDTGQTH